MRLLELFAGSRSVGKVAESMGWEVFSVDINSFDGINFVGDILDLTIADIPFVPDVIWASPPCTTYSMAAISHHRNGCEPKSDAAINADKVLDKTLEVFSWFPDAKFFMENPRAMMRKMSQTQNIHRETVCYCRYGDTRMKPTDIFTNTEWLPRPMCWNGNGDCHHEPAPRGSRTGTQGLKGAYDRSRIPFELVQEILTFCETRRINAGQPTLFYEVAQ